MVKGKLLESGEVILSSEAIRPIGRASTQTTEDDAFGDGASKEKDKPTPMSSKIFERPGK